MLASWLDGRRLPLGAALATVALHLAAIGAYGISGDELYAVACSERLAWGYLEFPPLSIVLLRLVRGALGDSLPALRALPVLAGGLAVYLTGRLCGRMGGSGWGQALALSGVALAPAYLLSQHVYGPRAFDLLVWIGAATIFVRLLDGGTRLDWIALGLVLGIGLLNRLSVLGLAFGLVIGLRFSAQRGWLMTPWPWLSGALALSLFAPHAAWQVAGGWPTLQLLRNASQERLLPISSWEFVAGQGPAMNPLLLVVAVAGLVHLLVPGEGRRYRPLALVFLSVLVLLLAFPTIRPSELAAAYPPLFAAGGAALDRACARFDLRRAPRIAVAVALAAGLALAPTGLPILPIDLYVRYAAALGIQPTPGERTEVGILPQHFAEMVGWESIVATVARAHDSLPETERARAAIVASSRFQAAAIDRFGGPLGLPPARSGHNQYGRWGPGDSPADVLIVLGADDAWLARSCGRVEPAGETDCGACLPRENGRPVRICRDLRAPLAELWPELRKIL